MKDYSMMLYVKHTLTYPMLCVKKGRQVFHYVLFEVSGFLFLWQKRKYYIFNFVLYTRFAQIIIIWLCKTFDKYDHSGTNLCWRCCWARESSCLV